MRNQHDARKNPLGQWGFLKIGSTAKIILKVSTETCGIPGLGVFVQRGVRAVSGIPMVSQHENNRATLTPRSKPQSEDPALSTRTCQNFALVERDHEGNQGKDVETVGLRIQKSGLPPNLGFPKSRKAHGCLSRCQPRQRSALFPAALIGGLGNPRRFGRSCQCGFVLK